MEREKKREGSNCDAEKPGKKTLNIWQLKWSIEGKKRRNKKSRRRRRETSLREEWVT